MQDINTLNIDVKKKQLVAALEDLKKIQIKEPRHSFPTSEELIREDRDR